MSAGRAAEVAARRALVAQLRAEGLSGRAIAGQLGMGEATVRRDLAWAAQQQEQAAPLPETAPPAPRRPVPGHIPAALREAFATTRGSPIPPHSPYQSGDPVQLHGFAGEQPGHRRTGFRGWVVATVGATVLTGITTTGEEWWEYWGRLHPDGQAVDLTRWCTCCQEERRRLLRAEQAQRAARGTQTALFGEVSR
ncbi:hypothetical protein D7231_35865 [Streptomyces klenkii]|uniref:Uncharacterized protein n=1 Tax=Streptomyces klenkii TaxID=1420899 RepID=A0A3A9ZPE4_9ACTN|nr:helix-turn-helix domain-containing protein [Streptomyces klenkii]RKN50082.1 hypothetical protein D7231_35865 [Streptomyces klenkii]